MSEKPTRPPMFERCHRCDNLFTTRFLELYGEPPRPICMGCLEEVDPDRAEFVRRAVEMLFGDGPPEQT